MGYSKEIYDKANQELNRRRQRAFLDKESRREKIYRELPEVRQMEYYLSHIGFSTAKVVAGGGNVREALEGLRDESLKTQENMRRLLASKGYVPEDLEEKYVCSACRDRGYIDGKMCGCLRTLLRETAFNQLNAMSPLPLENSRFDNFDLNYYSTTPNAQDKTPRQQMTRAFNYCRNYAENFNKHSESILMSGGTGLGKTHLSLAIAGELISKGFGVIYGTAPDIVNVLEKEHFRRGDPRESLNRMEECDLLIIDDLGTEFVSAFTKPAIYNLINSRIVREKPSIISTNLTLPELKERYSDRLISRLAGANMYISFIGDDIRLMKRQGKKYN